jgi:hypothetical protein
MWFVHKKRADQVASSIGEFIHSLSARREHDGPSGPEKLLRGLAPLLSEDRIIGQRVVKLIVALTRKAKFFVSLATTPDHSGHRLTLDGRGVYSGFSLACSMPPAKPCRTWWSVETFAETKCRGAAASVA